MVLAARLDSAFYESVEADTSLTREAFFVVLLAALATGAGTAVAYPDATVVGFLGGVVATILAWVAWSGITLVIGTRITRGSETKSDMGEMLRVLGYAHSPQLLIVFLFIPGIGDLIALAAALWSLIAGVIAIRQSLDFSTGRAVLTAGLGWLVVVTLRGLLHLWL
jgi:hypothetical protein